MKKRIRSGLLAAVLALSLLPGAAGAAGGGDAAVTIATDAELTAFCTRVNAGETSLSGVLTADIAVSGAWIPIGTEANPYAGNFDGQGHAVTVTADLSGSTGSAAYAGFFGKLSGAEIRNLTVNGTITGKDYTTTYMGGVAGYCKNTTLENCVNQAKLAVATYTAAPNYLVEKRVHRTGGVVGYAVDTQLARCENKANVSGLAFFGGIAGTATRVTFRQCVNSGDISYTATELPVSGTCVTLGGVAALLRTGNRVLGCVNTGTITVQVSHTATNEKVDYNAMAGGLAALSHGYRAASPESNNVIENSCNRGAVSVSVDVTGAGSKRENAKAGGAVGNEYAGGLLVANFYNTGTVTASVRETGGNAMSGGVIGGGIKATGELINVWYSGVRQPYGQTGPATQTNVTFFEPSDGVGAAMVTAFNAYQTEWSQYNAVWAAGADGYPVVTELTPLPAELRTLSLGGKVIIDQEKRTISAVFSGPGTDLSRVYVGYAETSMAGATVSPAQGETVDFSRGPVVFTVTSPAGVVTEYTATAVLNHPVITSFRVGGARGEIDQAARAITISLPVGMDLSQGFTPEVELADADARYTGGTLRFDSSTVALETSLGPSWYTLKCYASLPGAGTQEEPYQVSAASDFQVFGLLNGGVAGKYFRQTADLDFTGVDAPIARFDGHYDGGGFRILNHTGALFQTLSRATVENVVIDKSCTAEAGGGQNYWNIFVGLLAEKVAASRVLNCVNYGDATHLNDKADAANIAVGGLIGQISDGGMLGDTLIQGCVNYGTVGYRYNSAAPAGGVVGMAGSVQSSPYKVEIVDCHNYGTVDAAVTADGGWYGTGGYAGGVAGQTSGGIVVAGCSNRGAVSAGGSVGGIVGTADHTTFESCFNTGALTATNTGALQAVGGIAGTVKHNDSAFYNCYNAGALLGANSAAEVCRGGLVGYVQYGAATAGHCFLDEASWTACGGTAPATYDPDTGEELTGAGSFTGTAEVMTAAAMKQASFVETLNAWTEPVTYYGATFASDADGGNRGFPVLAHVGEVLDYRAYITSFVLAGRPGVIDEQARTITLRLPSGTNLYLLQPEITLSSGATVSPESGVSNDFSVPVKYTVTAQDGKTRRTYTVTATVPSSDQGLSNLSLTAGDMQLLPLEEFRQGVTEYSVTATDAVLLDAGTLELSYLAADGQSAVSAALGDTPGTAGPSGAYDTLTWSLDAGYLAPGENVLTIRVGTQRTYTVTLRVVPTLKSLTFTSGESAVLPQQMLDGTLWVDLPDGAQSITAHAEPHLPGAELAYDGGTEATLNVTELGETFPVTVGTGAAATTYTVGLNRLTTCLVTFLTTPEDAVVTVFDRDDKKVSPQAAGGWLLTCGTGYAYTYQVSRSGYVTKRGTLERADLGTSMLELPVVLIPASGGDLPDYDGDWLFFRGNPENMGVTHALTPASGDNAAVKWVMGASGSWFSTPTPPLIINGSLYIQSGANVLRVSQKTGEVLARGATAGSAGYSLNPLAYGEGMIFALLDNGRVQAFRADTLESLWVSQAQGGQTISPITYRNGYVYTGTWNSETASGVYFCLPVTDEDPNDTQETKYPTWTLRHSGGFYWAGAYAGDDYVLFGSDNGAMDGMTGDAALYSVDPTTGEVIDTITGIPGDIRSTVAYETGWAYFTTKGGQFWKVEVHEDGTFGARASFDTGTMCTGTPVVYGGVAFFGASGSSGNFGVGTLYAVDVETMSSLASIQTPGYVQSSLLLSDAYLDATGELYLYATYNMTPGGLNLYRYSREKKEFTESVIHVPERDQAQYNICSPICDADGTIYYKNDSGYLFAIRSMPEIVEIKAGGRFRTNYVIGERFDRTDLVVTATYLDGTTAPITGYRLDNTYYDTAGEFTVTVTYTGPDGKTLTDSFQVAVTDAKLDHLTMLRKPFKTAYIAGERFDPEGWIVYAHYSDGTSAEIHDYTYRPSRALTLEDAEIVLSYTVNGVTAELTLPITVTHDPIRVTFRLIGCTRSTADVDLNQGEAGYHGAEYVTWIPTTTYIMYEGDTMYDLFTLALDDADLRYIGAETNYVSTIYAPEICGGYGLSEFTNGQYSGWMYTVDGLHPSVGLKDYKLQRGDEVVWHYVNDYRHEVADWFDDPDYPALGDGTFYNRWLRAEDVWPTEAEPSNRLEPEVRVDRNGNATAEIDPEDMKKAIKGALDLNEDAIVIAPVGAEQSGKLTVSLKKESVTAMADQDLALEIDAPAGNLFLTADGVDDLAHRSGDPVELSLGVNEDGSVTVDVSVAGKSPERVQDGLKLVLPAKSGDVVVLVAKDGAQTILRKSVVTDGKAYVALPGPAAVKVVSNAKTFPDVAADAWYTGAVAFVTSHELFQGITGERFAPEAPMTRGMLATVLYRLEDEPDYIRSVSFADVAENAWYADGVLWAANQGIVTGIGNDRFLPDAEITREQLAAILYRYAGVLGLETGHDGKLTGYSDRSSISGWAREAMEWAVDAGLITGTGSGRLEPKATASRAQVATLLQRLVEQLIR